MYSCLNPIAVRSPEQTTMSGCKSLISLIARSIRPGTKWTSPQWMSEMWAIFIAGSVRPCRPRASDAASALVATFGAVAVEPARRAEAPRFADGAEGESGRLVEFYGGPGGGDT